MDKQPHTENIFDHLTGVRQISLKPHKDLVYQQECDQGDLEIQMPCYNLALEKCSDLRLRGLSAYFVRLPTLSLDAARTPSLCQAHLQGVFKDHLCRQFLYGTAMLCNMGELASFFIFPSRELFMHITVAM